MNEFSRREYRTRTWLVAALIVAAWLYLPSNALAGTLGLQIAVGGSTAWVHPADSWGCRVAPVPGICEMRPRRIWHEPVYELRRVLVDVPAKIATKRVPRYDRFGRLIGYKLRKTIVQPARTVWTTERVLVRAGYYETIHERVCIKPRTGKVRHGGFVVPSPRWVKPHHVKKHYPRPYRRVGRPFVSHRPREKGIRWSVGLGR